MERRRTRWAAAPHDRAARAVSRRRRYSIRSRIVRMPQTVLLREALELAAGAPCAPSRRQDLAQAADRPQAREPARGRAPPRCARRGAARRRAPRAAGTRGRDARSRRPARADRPARAASRAVEGRGAGGDAAPRVDRVGERGAELGGVARHHRRQPEAVDLLRRRGRAQDAAAVGDDEVHVRRRRLLGREDEVALVLAVRVVDHDDHPARGDPPDRFGNGEEQPLLRRARADGLHERAPSRDLSRRST